MRWLAAVLAPQNFDRCRQAPQQSVLQWTLMRDAMGHCRDVRSGQWLPSECAPAAGQ